MYKNVLETMQGIEIYPLISLGIFLSFFVLLLVWVIRMKQQDIDEVSRLPLDDDENDQLINFDSNVSGVKHV